MLCGCGFNFSEPGEFRKHQCLLTNMGWVDICPNCGATYLNTGEKIMVRNCDIISTDEQRQKQVDDFIKSRSKRDV